MILEKGKKVLLCIGAVVMPVITAGALFVGARNSIRPSSATGDPLVLNSTNKPNIVNNIATRVDEKNITWEYSGVQAFAGGHVTLNHQGYFGVSSSSAWGITAITSITAKFEANGNELWLLNSIDGVTWNEDCILESDTAVTTSNNWRYIRFYNWSDGGTSIDVTSISIAYNCAGTNAREDVDNARNDNVSNSLSSTNLTHEAGSGRVTGDTGISFRKTDNSSSYAMIGLNNEVKLKNIVQKSLEFDYYKEGMDPTKTAIFPAASLHYIYTDKDGNEKINNVGNSQPYNKDKTTYKFTSLGNYWWHIEIPITSLAPTLCGYKVNGKIENAPVSLDAKINAVKLTVGTSVIDNLRIGTKNVDLSFWNDTAAVSITGNPYLCKLAWVGVYHSCTMEFVNLDENDPDDSALVERVAVDGTICRGPFYIRGLRTGSVKVEITLTIGYDRHSVSGSKTIAVNA